MNTFWREAATGQDQLPAGRFRLSQIFVVSSGFDRLEFKRGVASYLDMPAGMLRQLRQLSMRSRHPMMGSTCRICATARRTARNRVPDQKLTRAR